MTTCWSSEQYFLVVSERSKMEVWSDCLMTEHSVEDKSMKDDKGIPSRTRILTRKKNRPTERPINEWTRMSARLPIILEDIAFSMYSSRDSPLDNPVISTCTTYHSRRSFLQRAQIFLRSQYSHVCDHIVFAESHRHLSWANCRHCELNIERPNEHHFEWMTRAAVYDQL